MTNTETPLTTIIKEMRNICSSALASELHISFNPKEIIQVIRVFDFAEDALDFISNCALVANRENYNEVIEKWKTKQASAVLAKHFGATKNKGGG